MGRAQNQMYLDPDNAWYVYFYSSSVYWDFGNRCYGQSIRPVTE